MILFASVRSAWSGRSNAKPCFERWVDIAVDEPLRSGDPEAAIPEAQCLFGHHLGYVKPRQGRTGKDIWKRLMDRVVGTDQKIGSCPGELRRRRQHDVCDALQIAVLQAIDVVRQRGGMQRDFRMGVWAETFRTFHTDGAVA